MSPPAIAAQAAAEVAPNFWVADEAADEFDDFAGEQNGEDDGQPDQGGVAPVVGPGDEDGGEEHDPVAREADDIERDRGEREDEEDGVEGVGENHADILAGFDCGVQLRAGIMCWGGLGRYNGGKDFEGAG